MSVGVETHISIDGQPLGAWLAEAPSEGNAPTLLPNAVFSDGRKCADPDCITRLCRYNPGPYCFMHELQERIYRRRREAIRIVRANGGDPRTLL